MLTKELPPISLLCKLFDYDIAENKLYYHPRPIELFKTKYQWRRWNIKYAFKEVEVKSLSIAGDSYAYHRILYAVVKKEDPHGFLIDHVSGNDYDNNINNLEKVTPRENQQRKRFQKKGRAQRELINLERLKLKIQSVS